MDEGKTAGAPPALWMPGLFGTGRRPSAAEAALPAIRRLWPGLPARLARPARGGALAWTPPDPPFPESEMGAFVAELERVAADGARGGQGLGEAVAARAREERGRREAEEIRAARGLAEPDEGSRLLRRRRRAQRILAWHWFAQRVRADIEELVRKIDAGVDALGAGLSDGEGPGVPVPPLGGALAGAGDISAPSAAVLLRAAAELAPGAVFVFEDLPEEVADPADLVEDPPFADGLGLPSGTRVRGAEVALGADGEATVRVLLLGEGA